MICAGIDAGSRTIKVVLLDKETLAVRGSGIASQGVGQAERAARLLTEVCQQEGIEQSEIEATVSTGYGRNAIDWATRTITEITCQACGVHHQDPAVNTVIDIGGQDSKLIRLDENGGLKDFAMNDRCAAGTGRFLEVVAGQLGITIEEMGTVGRNAPKPCAISSMCVVFAETEIIGLLAAGESQDNIVAGVQRSIASRIRSMAGRKISEPIAFAGGVALLPSMGDVLSEVLGHPVKVTANPQLTGALGAAILAARKK